MDEEAASETGERKRRGLNIDLQKLSTELGIPGAPLFLLLLGGGNFVPLRGKGGGADSVNDETSCAMNLPSPVRKLFPPQKAYMCLKGQKTLFGPFVGTAKASKQTDPGGDIKTLEVINPCRAALGTTKKFFVFSAKKVTLSPRIIQSGDPFPPGGPLGASCQISMNFFLFFFLECCSFFADLVISPYSFLCR